MTLRIPDIITVIGTICYVYLSLITLIGFAKQADQRANERGVIYVIRILAVGTAWPFYFLGVMWADRATVWAWVTDRVRWLLRQKSDYSNDDEVMDR